MKKLIIVTMIILIGVFTNSIEAYNNNNNFKFIGYTPEIKSELFEDIEGVTLVINNNYNVYELFIPTLEDFSIICES